MPPSQYNSSQYDFFLNNQQQPHKLGGPANTRARIILVIGGLIALVVIIVIVNSFLGSGDKAQTQRLTEVAQAEAEIIRISSLGAEQAKTTDTLNYATTTKMSIESSQQQTRKALDKRGLKAKKLNKLLSAGKNSKTDATLDEARRNNRYDEALTTVLNKQLTDYQKLLKAARDNGKPSEQKVLKASIDNAGRLLPKTDATSLPSGE